MFNFATDIINNLALLVVGGLITIWAIIVVLWNTYLVVTGVTPMLFRLGKSLAQRKIAIFAECADFQNLKSVLIDSKLFKEKNIIPIDKNSIKKAETESLLLMHWSSFQQNIDEILKCKKDSAALIIYAPSKEERISGENMEKLEKHRNIIVVNFRGRLLNDVLVCMMTSQNS